MKAQELRIGNYVLFENEIQEISSIHSDNTIRLRKNKDENCHGCYKVNNEKIKPIELTEDLLGNINWRGYNLLYLNSSFSMDEVGHIFYRRDYIGVNVKYVHQLQNLYFALTGVELELSSNVA